MPSQNLQLAITIRNDAFFVRPRRAHSSFETFSFPAHAVSRESESVTRPATTTMNHDSADTISSIHDDPSVSRRRSLRRKRNRTSYCEPDDDDLDGRTTAKTPAKPKTTTTNTSSRRDDDDEFASLRVSLLAAVGEDVHDASPLLELFVLDEKLALHAITESVARKNLRKGAVRRLLEGLLRLARLVVERREYCPQEKNEEEDVDETTTAKALLLLRCCAEMETAVLEGLAASTSSSSSSSSSAKGTKSRPRRRSWINSKDNANTAADTASSPPPPPPPLPKSLVPPAFTLASLLHSTLLSLPFSSSLAAPTRDAVMNLCRFWYASDYPDRVLLVTQWIPCLLAKTLSENDGRRVNLTRLYQHREAMRLLDCADDNSSYLRTLFVRTVSDPLWLEHGAKCAAFLFQLHPAVVRDLHRAIKERLPEVAKSTKRKKTLSAYGEIYYRAWKEAHDDDEKRRREGGEEAEEVDRHNDGEDSDSDSDDANDTVLHAVTKDALQDLMNGSLNLADESLRKAVTTVLSTLFRERNKDSVEHLLYVTYTPLLWRAVKSANPIVRRNACEILGRVFPLRDPYETHNNAAGHEVDVGVDALLRLAEDDDPRVRCEAAETAVVRVLGGGYWDVVPPEGIRRILTVVAGKHCSDRSSSAVRKNAVVSVTRLLRNEPRSHPALRAILPSIGNSIHDRIERVRVAVVRMLATIKTLKGLRYYHVVPVDHLLARLAAEDDPVGLVASGLSSLLLNSYFPTGGDVTGSAQMERTLGLLANHPEAARVFYGNLHRHLNLRNVSKLLAMFFRCLAASVERELQEEEENEMEVEGADNNDNDDNNNDRSTNEDADDDGNNNNDDSHIVGIDLNVLTAANTSMMAAIARTMCSVLESVAPALERDEGCRTYLVEAFLSGDRDLVDAISYFETRATRHAPDSDARRECEETAASLLRCAGWAPPEAAGSLAERAEDRLQRGTGSHASAYAALLCLWGREEDVARAFERSLSPAYEDGRLELESPTDDDRAKRRKNAQLRSSTGSETTQREENTDDNDAESRSSPDRALRALSDLMGGINPACVTAREILIASDTACGIIERTLERAMDVLGTSLFNHSISCKITHERVVLLLSSCETFARFALHKQAAKEEGGDVSAQSEKYMAWITDVVVPSLTTTQNNPLEHVGRGNDVDDVLGDLSISRISIEESFDDDDVPMSSPKHAVDERDRRRDHDSNEVSDSAHKRQRISASFSHEHDLTTAHYSQAAALSLVRSAVLLFAEWLAVGGDGGSTIARHASKWCRVLAPRLRDDHNNDVCGVVIDTATTTVLFPSLCRLASQLIVKCTNFSLFRETLTVRYCRGSGDDYEEIDGTIRKVVNGIMTLHRSKSEFMVETICDTAKMTRDAVTFKNATGDGGNENEKENENENNHHRSPPRFKGPVGTAMSYLFSSNHGSVELAKYLTKYINNVDRKEVPLDKESYLFESKCLLALCRSYRSTSSNSHNAKALKRIVATIDDANFSDSYLGEILLEIKEVFASSS